MVSRSYFIRCISHTRIKFRNKQEFLLSLVTQYNWVKNGFVNASSDFDIPKDKGYFLSIGRWESRVMLENCHSQRFSQLPCNFRQILSGPFDRYMRIMFYIFLKDISKVVHFSECRTLLRINRLECID
jgi:hypothetical protein